MSLLAQIPPFAEEAITFVGDRALRISFWDAHMGTIRGVVAPCPLHTNELDPTYGMEIETAASFRARHEGDGDPVSLEVQNISVVPSMHRQGWGSDMVRALMATFPNAMLEVSGPNDQSGPMFNKLSRLYPNRVKPSPIWLF